MSFLRFLVPTLESTLNFWIEGYSKTCQSVQINDPTWCINQQRMIPWNRLGDTSYSNGRLGEKGEVRGWAGEGHSWGFSSKTIPALAHLSETLKKQVTVDIQDIQGLESSKSELDNYHSLNDFAIERCAGLIETVSMDSLNKVMSHKETRIFHGTGDHLTQYAWDPHLFLSNNGGSHHFVAARFLAKELDINVPITAEIQIQQLNPQAVESLNEDYALFALPHSSELLNSLCDTLSKNQVEHHWVDMNRPFDLKVIVLDKSNKKALKVAALFQKANFCDVGQKLQELLAAQNTLKHTFSNKGAVGHKTSIDSSFERASELLQRRRSDTAPAAEAGRLPHP